MIIEGVLTGTVTNVSMFMPSTAVNNFYMSSYQSVCGASAVTVGNMLVFGKSGQSTSVAGYNQSSGALTLNYDGYFGPGSYSAGSPTSTNQFSTNPAFGSCYLWVPTASPAKGAGISGADIGADILYETVGGTTGITPLWSTASQCHVVGGVQQADCPVGAGAIIAGLNDQAGQSYGDIGNRLNVNKASCAYPTGFTPAP